MAQGPIAWYSFDVEGDPGHDSVGTNNGTPSPGTSVTQVAGVKGRAASFTNGYITLPTTSVFDLRGGDFTLSVFVKGDPGSNNRNWFTKAITISPGSSAQHLYGIGGNSLVGFGFDGGPNHQDQVTSSKVVFDGKWHHVAGVKRQTSSGPMIELWVDGHLEGTAPEFGTSDGGVFGIGRIGACCEFFNGQMDEAKIWNRALSGDEIASEASLLNGGSPRTLLVTFTGGNDAPDGSNCIAPPPFRHAGTQVVYGTSTLDLLFPSRGMTNLLVNAKNVAPDTAAQAFTFYSNGGTSCDQFLTNTAHHAEAEFWVTNNVTSANDRIIIAGHSYGGNRARIFAEQIDEVLYHLYSRHMIEGLVLVDPIDYATCHNADPLECLQGSDPPRDIRADVVKPEQAFVFRQMVDIPYQGYTITVGGQPVSWTYLHLGHRWIDDAEPVQRYILNLLRPPTPVITPGVTLGLYLLNIDKQPSQTFTVHLIASNTGRLILDNISVSNATLGSASCYATIGSQPVLPGKFTPIDLTCDAGDAGHSGATVRLSLTGTDNNFSFGGSARVTLP